MPARVSPGVLSAGTVSPGIGNTAALAASLTGGETSAFGPSLPAALVADRSRSTTVHVGTSALASSFAGRESPTPRAARFGADEASELAVAHGDRESSALLPSPPAAPLVAARARFTTVGAGGASALDPALAANGTTALLPSLPAALGVAVRARFATLGAGKASTLDPTPAANGTSALLPSLPTALRLAERARFTTVAAGKASALGPFPCIMLGS
jgi:hypothetical protein